MPIALKRGLCWAILCLLGVNPAFAERRTVFIIDGTAQMSAKLGQQRKIDAVKGAVSAVASLIEPSSSVALWALGTNPARKCEDRGALVPLQPAGTAARAIGQSLGPLQPRAARAPVFDTLRAALTALGEPKDAPVSAILIGGTGDDCLGDVCSEAKRLHDTFPNAKLSVLGLGMNEQTAANLTCAAKAMGGTFTAIKSGTDLDRTLRQTLDIAPNAKASKLPVPRSDSQSAPPPQERKSDAGNSSGAPAPTGSAAPVPEPAQEQQAGAKANAAQTPQPEPNVGLSAALAAGSPPLEAGVTWEVYKINVTPTGQLRQAEVPSWTGGGGQAKLKLGEGRYAVHASYGLANAAGEITAGPGYSERTIILDAGTIAAEALQTRDSQPAEGAFFLLYRRKAGGTLELLSRSSERPALFNVNAGEYFLSASAGLAKLDAIVKAEAGKVSAVRMALNIGTLEIKTQSGAGGQQAVGAWHEIYSANSRQGAQPLLRIAGTSHRVQLPAGNYRLMTAFGNARVESAVPVVAGQTTSQTVVLNIGEAKVSSPAGKPAKVCSVYEADSNRNSGPVGRAAGTDINFILKAGVYDLECRPVNSPAPPKQAQIRVVGGEVQEAKIEE